MDLFGKDQNTSVQKVTERAKPTLVTIGKKQIISTGRWNNELMADYVLTDGRSKWLQVGDLARRAYAANTPRNKARVRQCLHQLFKYLLQTHGELLVTEYGPPRNHAKAVKLYSYSDSALERQNLAIKLERMRKRSEITTDDYEAATTLLHQREREGEPKEADPAPI